MSTSKASDSNALRPDSAAMAATGSIAFAAMGGTIIMARHEDGGLRPSHEASNQLAELALSGCHQVRMLDLEPMPSPHVGEPDMIRLAELIETALADGCTAAIVTHGTDTLEETALALDMLVTGEHPVVMTGAMVAPDNPGSDGPANLTDAFAVATHPDARGRGTLAVLNASIYPAATLNKAHTFRRDAFHAHDGSLGHVSEGCTVFLRRGLRTPALPGRPDLDMPPVPLIMPAPGDTGRMVEMARDAGAPGLTFAAFGGGHLPPSMLSAVTRTAEQAPIVIATRCNAGGTLSRTYGYAGSEIDLAARGAIFAGRLPPQQARLALSLLCRTGAGVKTIREYFRSFGGS